MSSSSVWVQLYYEGKDEPRGHPVKIIPIPTDIDALAKAVKAELKPIIDYAPVNEIFVFSPDTERPFSQDKAIDPGERVRPGTTSKKPLIVVAPAQKHDEDDNILGQGVYEKLTGAVCFFSDQENKPIGAGFAVSGTTVYSVAHNFPESAVGMERLCQFGKPNQNLVRQLRISAVDHRLDYCILRTVPGEASLPNFLEISTAPLQTGRNCILAAFQIGIQDDLKYLDPDLSVGIFKGEISKLYPRHFVYQCPSFAGDSGGAVVLKNGKVIGIHQETVIQARERIQHGEDLDSDARLESVEASIDELLRSLSSGSIGLQLSAISEPKSSFEEEGEELSPDENGKGESPLATARKNEQGEAFFNLNDKGLRRCTVRSFKGTVLIDLREYYEKDGKKLPGKKGISLSKEQYEMFKKLIELGVIDKEIASLSLG